MILLEVRIEIELPEKLVEACKIGEETITEAYIKGQKLCINIYAEAPDMRKAFMENGLVCKENCSCCGYKE